MNIKTTDIPGLLIIKPLVFEDKRGCFFESYNKKLFDKNIKPINFIQDNVSHSVKNTIRGLHYQLSPYSQTKLVQAIYGKILDVAVDLRENSPGYGKYYAVELSDENKLQFLIPKGCAHGFSVLSDKAVIHYKCDNFFNKTAERGIYYKDPFLAIDWKIPLEKSVLSEKDEILPSFENAEKNFFFSGNILDI